MEKLFGSTIVPTAADKKGSATPRAENEKKKGLRQRKERANRIPLTEEAQESARTEPPAPPTKNVQKVRRTARNQPKRNGVRKKEGNEIALRQPDTMGGFRLKNESYIESNQ